MRILRSVVPFHYTLSVSSGTLSNKAQGHQCFFDVYCVLLADLDRKCMD